MNIGFSYETESREGVGLECGAGLECGVGLECGA